MFYHFGLSFEFRKVKGGNSEFFPLIRIFQNIGLKLHSKRVEKMQNYTRNECRRCKTTLETSVEDAKLHSKRVYFLTNCHFGSHSLNPTQAAHSATSTPDQFALETYSRIGLVRGYGNLHSYWTSTKLRKLTVVLD